MALPALLAILALVDYPLAFAAYFSFGRILPGQPGGFIGLENYSRMLRAHQQIRDAVVYRPGPDKEVP